MCDKGTVSFFQWEQKRDWIASPTSQKKYDWEILGMEFGCVAAKGFPSSPRSSSPVIRNKVVVDFFTCLIQFVT